MPCKINAVRTATCGGILGETKKHPKSESNEIFQTSEFIELTIHYASRHQVTVEIDGKELIRIRADGTEILSAVQYSCSITAIES